MSGFGKLAKTISRYVQLTYKGRELHGDCPFCETPSLRVLPKRDEADGNYPHRPENWACLNCGAHDHGNTAEDFVSLADKHNLKAGDVRKPIKEPLKGIRWTQVLPPEGSRPEFDQQWLGTPLSIEEEFKDNKLSSYKVTYEKHGTRRWIFVRYGDNDPGSWKCRRLNIRERVMAMYPEVPKEVAEKIKGRKAIRLSDLTDAKLRSYKAKAAAFHILSMGWSRQRVSRIPGSQYIYKAPLT